MVEKVVQVPRFETRVAGYETALKGIKLFLSNTKSLKPKCKVLSIAVDINDHIGPKRIFKIGLHTSNHHYTHH